MNLGPLRDWYRQHAPHVQMDTTRWGAALHPHQLEDLTLAVELLERDLPDGNLPTPALVNALLTEVEQARNDVVRGQQAAKGYAAYQQARATGFGRKAS